MKKKYLKTCISVLAVTAVLLSACGGPQQKNVGKTTMETAKLADSTSGRYENLSRLFHSRNVEQVVQVSGHISFQQACRAYTGRCPFKGAFGGQSRPRKIQRRRGIEGYPRFALRNSFSGASSR